MSQSLAPGTATSAQPPAGLRLLAVAGACTLVGGLAGIPGVGDDQGFLAFLLVAVVGAVAAPPVLAAACAALGWAVFTGFVANDYGQLTASGDDLVRLALLLGAALLTAWCSRAGSPAA